jgi:serine/threonine-protein kinase PRP4
VDADARKGAWREELEVQNSKEDIDVPADGLEPDEDGAEVEEMLKRSKLRREALIKKWLSAGEAEKGSSGGLEMPDTDTPLQDGGSDSDKETKNFFAEQRKAQEEAETAGKEKPSLEDKQALNRFIMETKAAQEQDGDMFDENEEEQEALKRGENQATNISQTGASVDDWNDVEGYYRAQVGELMSGRYRVVEAMCGKGVFSNVIKAKDQQKNELVAIKVMRTNDMMRKAAEKEIEVLQRLNRADKGNKKNVIRLLTTFNYREHLCLVFECMWDNLRVALKKYTRDTGMSLKAVRAYTKQLLVGLRHIHKCEVIHADIKPDNILISAGHNLVKICDLGSAVEISEVETTTYLVSRFYRAPEIVLGAKYGPPSDVFALGASLCELFTGKILFPGKSNNDMLRHFMELKGKFPHKMIKTGTAWKQHFDENFDFKYLDYNKATRKKVTRTITDCSAKRSILDVVMLRVGADKQKSSADSEAQLYVKKAKQFADLIGQMTTLDPEKRATCDDLLNHNFVAEGHVPGGPAPQKKSEGKAEK